MKALLFTLIRAFEFELVVVPVDAPAALPSVLFAIVGLATAAIPVPGFVCGV